MSFGLSAGSALALGAAAGGGAALLSGGGGGGGQPQQVDASRAQGEYLFGPDFSNYQGVTDPILQERVLQSEGQFRPRYTSVELGDIERMLLGQQAQESVENPSYQNVLNRIADVDSQLEGRFTGGEAAQLPWEDYQRLKQEQQQLNAQLKNIPEFTQTQDVRGLLDLQEEASKRSFDLQQEQLSRQRAADVGALQEYAPQVVDAYRAADPESTRLAEMMSSKAGELSRRGENEGGRTDSEQLLKSLGMEYMSSTGQLSPLEARNIQQQAIERGVLRGRERDDSTLYDQMSSRVAEELNKRDRDLTIGSGLLGQESALRQSREGMGISALQGAFGMNRNLAGDVGMALLGRPSSGISLGQQTLGQAQGGAAQPVGPQLYDPNAGINLASQHQANLTNFGIAQAGASSTRDAGMMQMLGVLGAGAMTACWVAREVYGQSDPKWMMFREWMLNDAPSWFRNWYLGNGETYAEYIKDKPSLKNRIRSFMDKKIKEKYGV